MFLYFMNEKLFTRPVRKHT